MKPISLDGVQSVRVLCLGRLGDLLVATPLFAGLRSRFPGARISLVTGERGEEAARLIADVDECLVLRRWTRLFSNLGLAARLRFEKADLLLDLNAAYSRASWTLAALAAARMKVAFEKTRGNGIYTRRIGPPGEAEHMLSRYRRVAQALGAPYEPRLRIRLSPEDESSAAELLSKSLASGGLLVGVFPGNFKKFDNRWQKRKFAELMRRMQEAEGLRLYVLCGPGEEGQVGKLLARLSRSVPVIGPLPIALTAAVLKKTDLLVTNATGTAHLAAAVGTPTFSVLSGYTRAVWMYPAPGQEGQDGRGPRHFSAVSASWSTCRDVPVEAAWEELRKALDWARAREASAA
ncbi:MAG: glycosyltransferase family 9 protein [Elusimicrobia bacterium]|nr:glycosyltransferase family 9 protein [Elusimicrobiota bacterium]